jgi:hypothetical protein
MRSEVSRSGAEFSAGDRVLADQASNIRDAAALVRRAVSGVDSERASELSALADRLYHEFDEVHTIVIQPWAPELVR